MLEEKAKAIMAEREAHLQTLRGKRVIVAIPTIHQTTDIKQAVSLIEETRIAASVYGISIGIFHYADSLITRSRSFMTHNIRKRFDPDYIMWLDSDIRFQPTAILQLLATGLDIVAGAYPIKAYDPKRLEDAIAKGVAPEHLLKYAARSVAYPREALSMATTNYEPWPMTRLGTGFMLTSKRVYDVLEPRLEDYRVIVSAGCRVNEKEVETCVAFFYDGFSEFEQDGVRYREWLSEDYWFCEQAFAAGIQPYVLPSIQLEHVGPHVFEGDPVRAIGHVYPGELKK